MDDTPAPADGVITGWGHVDGRPVAVAAYDFTVMAGSMGMTGEIKVARIRELALTKRIPLVWLLDYAGARVQEAVGAGGGSTSGPGCCGEMCSGSRPRARVWDFEACGWCRSCIGRWPRSCTR